MNLRMLVLAGAVFLVPNIALSDDANDEGERGNDCFYQNQMRHYQVVDDQHIVVEVSNNRYYLVELWRPVRFLDNSRRIAFKSATNRVCSRFSEVLVDGGVRIRSIRQISEDERDSLMNQGEQRQEAQVEGAEIEPIETEGAEIEDLVGEDPDEEQDENQQ